MSAFLKNYSNFFSIDEIEKNKKLQYVFWVLLLGFYLAFSVWNHGPLATKQSFLDGSYTCPEYFRSCGELYFFDNLPLSYSKDFFYGILFFFMLLSAYFAVKKRWTYAHLSLIPLTVWKTAIAFFLTDSVSVPWEYFHIGFLYVWLFFSYKLYFLRLTFVTLYFIAGIVKLDDAWMLGTYFTSLKLGLPFVPESMTPIATNIVIIVELLTPFLLLNNNLKTRKVTLFFYIVFHLYSTILVAYRYPTHCFPMLLILFATNEKFNFLSPKKNALIGYSYIFLILLLNLWPHFLPINHRETYEGRRLSMGMFDANRQCESQETYSTPDKIETQTFRSKHSMARCFPYQRWFFIQQECKRKEKLQVNWTFSISLNGGPFYKIVESPNACKLTYKSFFHNQWINVSHRPEDIVGYPHKNALYGAGMYSGNHTDIIYPKESIQMSRLQLFLKKYISYLYAFYLILFLLFLIIFLKRKDLTP